MAEFHTLDINVGAAVDTVQVQGHAIEICVSLHHGVRQPTYDQASCRVFALEPVHLHRALLNSVDSSKNPYRLICSAGDSRRRTAPMIRIGRWLSRSWKNTMALKRVATNHRGSRRLKRRFTIAEAISVSRASTADQPRPSSVASSALNLASAASNCSGLSSGPFFTPISARMALALSILPVFTHSLIRPLSGVSV